MFVNAPRLLKNGSLTIKDRVYRIRSAGPKDQTEFPTIEAAFAAASKDGLTFVTESGFTKRQFMQKGVVSFKRYKNTKYACSYKSWKTEGSVEKVLRKAPNKYIAESSQLVLGPDSFASKGVWVLDSIDDLDPGGSRGTIAAVSNRALLLNLRNRLTTETLTRAGRKDIDLGVALAESGKTVEMVSRRMLQVLRAWRELRKRNIHGALKALGLDKRKSMDRYLNDLPNLWLELQYGWLPLLNDIYGGFQAVKHLVHPDQQPRFSVRRRGTTDLFIGDPIRTGGHFMDLEYDNHAQGRVEVKYLLEITDSLSVFLNSLGLTNPLSVAWEVVPFSFVVDWLLPVGTMLEAVTAPLGLKFVDGYVSTVTYGVQAVSSTRAANMVPYTQVARRGRTTSTATGLFMGRELLSSWPIVAPYIRLPFSSSTRVLNALALLHQQRRMR